MNHHIYYSFQEQNDPSFLTFLWVSNLGAGEGLFPKDLGSGLSSGLRDPAP